MAGEAVTFSGADAMFAHLDEIPDMVSIDGIVARVADGTKDFNFSVGGCGAWVGVDHAVVESFQPLGKIACGDHFHHRVRLRLKRPTDGTGALLADLLHTHGASAVTFQPRSPVTAGFAAPGPDQQCPQGYYWDAASGTYRCKG